MGITANSGQLSLYVWLLGFELVNSVLNCEENEWDTLPKICA